MSKHLLTLLAAIGFSFATGALAQPTLNLITSYPKGALLNEPMQKFVDELNERGKGVVRIRIVGGPEVTPVSEQYGSVARGINQIYYGSISYCQGQIDESRALVLSDYDVTELRKRGSIDKLAKYFEKKPKLHYLAYFGSGYTFYIYLNKEPKRTGDGVDLTGMRVRGPSIWQPVIVNLKAAPVNVEVGEMYTALERGAIDGIGWLDVGLTDFSWQKHLKYRITPNFWRGDVSLVINQAAWEALPKQAKDVLTQVALKHEPLAHTFLRGRADEELKKLRAAGVQDIELKGAARESHLRAANEALWKIIEDKSGKETRAELEAAFTSRGK